MPRHYRHRAQPADSATAASVAMADGTITRRSAKGPAINVLISGAIGTMWTRHAIRTLVGQRAVTGGLRIGLAGSARNACAVPATIRHQPRAAGLGPGPVRTTVSLKPA